MTECRLMNEDNDLKKVQKAIQHELFPFDTGISRDLLLDMLSCETNKEIKLTITTNRVAMASIDMSKPRIIKIRLHEKYLNAPEEVITALKNYIKFARKSDWNIISAYGRRIVQENMRPARRVRKPLTGKVYHLGEIRDNVNRCFFNNSVSCKIEWGNQYIPTKTGRKSRSIRYGSWIPDLKTVRINPLLDDERVPYEFIRYIVFHEMLHSVVPNEVHGNRNRYHSVTFKRLERAFPNLDVMHKLAKDLIPVLKGK